MAKRANKTTRRQYEIYLSELRINKPFRENKFEASDPDILKKAWGQLTTKLNACGGPQKDTVGWKRVFTDWKSQVRAKARKNRAAYLETGNVGIPPKILSDLEEELLDITGRVVVDGMPVQELGIEPSVTDNSNSLRNLEIEGSETVPSVNLLSKSSFSKNNLEIERRETVPSAVPSVNLPSKSSFPKNAGDFPRKRKNSLTSALNAVLNKNDATSETTAELRSTLAEINTNIKNLVKIQKKKLCLKQMKLQLQYPDYEFVLNSEEEN